MGSAICKTAITLAAPLSPSIFLWTGSDLKYFTHRVGALSFGHNCGFRGKARVGYTKAGGFEIRPFLSSKNRVQLSISMP